MARKKIILIVGLLILLISVPAGVLLLRQQTIFHLGAQDPNQPEDVSISAGEQIATITWTTQNPVQSLVSYGISPNNLTLIQPENTPAVNHRINLSGLQAGSNYFFTIKVDKKTFDKNGQPFTFTTKTKETPLPTAVPTLSLSEEGFQSAMGTANSTFDLNKDGIVNSLDLMLFRSENK